MFTPVEAQESGLAEFSLDAGSPTTLQFIQAGRILFILHPDGTVEPGDAWVTTEDSAQKFIEWVEVYWGRATRQRDRESD